MWKFLTAESLLHLLKMKNILAMNHKQVPTQTTILMQTPILKMGSEYLISLLSWKQMKQFFAIKISVSGAGYMRGIASLPDFTKIRQFLLYK